jgi:hypothetical protein
MNWVFFGTSFSSVKLSNFSFLCEFSKFERSQNSKKIKIENNTGSQPFDF